MSGHGPLEQVGAALTDHIVSVAGANSARIYVQSNGLGPNGDWGAPEPSHGAVYGSAAVWSRAVLRGEQMIQPGDYNWAQVFANPIANAADYVEVYIESFPREQHRASSRRRSPRSRNCSADPASGRWAAGRELEVHVGCRHARYPRETSAP